MPSQTVVRHECSRCGRRATADRMVYSTHTRRRYCVDLDSCARRAARARKQVAA